ncbi:Hsp20/alpha crystallin family protein [Candidatus Giovannonibacteria bacterium]|nr:Hsp20/alpha crystallin family protein [Candidatus Giovannonibacteria bacterium]
MEKRSFFERLTGSVNIEDEPRSPSRREEKSEIVTQQNEEEGQLTIDMWQTNSDIVLQAIVGGIKPDELEVSISNDMVTIRGKRERTKEISSSDYYYQELYWGTFSRSVMLPQEVDSDEAEATIKAGLLTIRIPKLDKTKVQKLKVKNE